MKLHEKSLLGKRVYGYNTTRGAEFLSFPVEEEKPVLKVDTKSQIDAVLDSIFAVDSLTKLPIGDLGVFTNKNTSEEVRRYIQDNLLADNGGVSDTSKYGDLPDSVIADYMRNSDETIYQYRDRVVSIMRQNAKEYQKKDDKS